MDIFVMTYRIDVQSAFDLPRSCQEVCYFVPVTSYGLESGPGKKGAIWSTNFGVGGGKNVV